MDHQKVRQARALIRELERSLKDMKQALKHVDAFNVSVKMPPTEDEERGRRFAQSRLAKWRDQQRYMLLAYAFMRGKKYKTVEKKCHQIPSFKRMQLAYAILTRSLLQSVGDAQFFMWIHDTKVIRGSVIKNNKLPPEKVMTLLRASHAVRVR
jgi:hypothetical protein